MSPVVQSCVFLRVSCCCVPPVLPVFRPRPCLVIAPHLCLSASVVIRVTGGGSSPPRSAQLNGHLLLAARQPFCIYCSPLLSALSKYLPLFCFLAIRPFANPLAVIAFSFLFGAGFVGKLHFPFLLSSMSCRNCGGVLREVNVFHSLFRFIWNDPRSASHQGKWEIRKKMYISAHIRNLSKQRLLLTSV